MFDALGDKCGGKEKLKALGWSKFGQLVDSAVDAGIIWQIRDGGITWLVLKTPTDRNPLNQAPVISTPDSAFTGTTTIPINEAKLEMATIAAKVHDPKTETYVAPILQNQVQADAEELPFIPLYTSAQTPTVESAIPVEQLTQDAVLKSDVVFTEEVYVFSLKHSHSH